MKKISDGKTFLLAIPFHLQTFFVIAQLFVPPAFFSTKKNFSIISSPAKRLREPRTLTKNKSNLAD